MKRKPTISREVKLQACREYETGRTTYTILGREIGVHRETVRQWWLKYKYHGEKAFDSLSRVVQYPDSLRKEIIEKYLSGDRSAKIIGAEYNIYGNTIINWVNAYYHGNEKDSNNLKEENITMKKRPTTLEERLDIVHWVIENDMDSKEASKKYGIAYTTIRNWVSKYMKEGTEGLVYKKRGRKNVEVDESTLSEMEKLKLELQRERELRKMREFEIEVLKKKEEFEKKRRYRK
jgi:transposase-like protein